MNTRTLNLEKYRCRKCGRLFYIDVGERHSLDLDFGCPYGCDDNRERIRVVRTVGMGAEHMETLLYNQASTEELVQALVELIKTSPILRKAILEIVWTCPHVRMQV